MTITLPTQARGVEMAYRQEVASTSGTPEAHVGIRLSALAGLAGLARPARSHDASLSIAGTFSSFHPHRRFCCEGESAEYVYRIAEGVAEGYRMTSDGRKQIIEFYSHGDIFGIEAGNNYTIFVDSITEGRVQIFRRTLFTELVCTHVLATTELWACLSARVHRSQEHILRLGRTAEERLAGFILEMCDRISGADQILLPMTRQDIGDHLGLTIETVSRTLTHLQKIGAIRLAGSRNVSIDRKKLSRLIPI